MATTLDDLDNIATAMAIFEVMIYDHTKRTQARGAKVLNLIDAFSDDYKRVEERLRFLSIWIHRMVENPTVMMECKNVDPLFADFMECARLKNMRTETPLTEDVLQQKLDVAIFRSRFKRGLGTDTPHVECANCLQCTMKTKKCSGCNIYFYCDKKCQIQHWPEHRRDCIAVLHNSAEIID